jgi:hypothetical protein
MAEYRIVQNDHEYERIAGLREAKAARFRGKVAFYIGVPGILVYGLGLLLIMYAATQFLQAAYLEKKFE